MQNSLEFVGVLGQKPGIVESLLDQSYAGLLKSDAALWEPERANWKQFDHDVFNEPETVGACIFFARMDDRLVGFASWDPRQWPRLGIIGHNCVLPEFRGRGIGKQQVREILRRFSEKMFARALVATCDHPFFVPARSMYAACGFSEARRRPWERAPRLSLIEYEMKVSPGDEASGLTI